MTSTTTSRLTMTSPKINKNELMRFPHMLKSRYDEEVNILDFHSKIKGSNPFAVTKMGANVPRGR